MVYYRKYRPQKISELDSESVRDSLNAIFSKESSIHAFLFTGPKGLGKTSTARIVAKVINCTGRKNKTDAEPCNKCEQCISIVNGNNLDILEIDGASNRGIDEIRDLREKIKLSPFKAKKKIYIIDEVHMLTTEAFNALLKTLEEPPSHAVFILCTTETAKIPATIASRCFRINFIKATTDELVRSMQRIVKEEDLRIENDALTEIASLSDGSFRDAAKILEEIVSFSGRKNITKELVNEKLQMTGIGQNIDKMLMVFKEKDVKKGLALCHELLNQGMDFRFFTQKLIEKLHFMLLVEVGVEKGESMFSLSEIKKLFEILSDAHIQTKSAVLPQTPLEIAVIEWGEAGEDSGLSHVAVSVHNESISRQPHLADDARQDNKKIKENLRSLNERLSSNSKSISNVSSRTSFSSSASGLPSDNFFSKLINEVKEHNNLFAGVLRGCKAEEIQTGKLIIAASSKFHKEKIEEAKNMKLLEELAEKINGKKVKIIVNLKSA